MIFVVRHCDLAIMRTRAFVKIDVPPALVQRLEPYSESGAQQGVFTAIELDALEAAIEWYDASIASGRLKTGDKLEFDTGIASDLAIVSYPDEAVLLDMCKRLSLDELYDVAFA